MITAKVLYVAEHSATGLAGSWVELGTEREICGCPELFLSLLRGPHSKDYLRRPAGALGYNPCDHSHTSPEIPFDSNKGPSENFFRRRYSERGK